MTRLSHPGSRSDSPFGVSPLLLSLLFTSNKDPPKKMNQLGQQAASCMAVATREFEKGGFAFDEYRKARALYEEAGEVSVNGLKGE